MRLSRCPHGSLLCPASRFTHFAATTFRTSYLNYFTPYQLHSFQPLAVHRLPVLGSPAGRCGLRLKCFICLRFALAFFSGSLVYSFHAVVLASPKYPIKTRRSTSHICRKGFLDTQTISLHHPCSTRRRLAMLGQCPQTIPLRSIHCSHRPAVRLKAVSPV